jgi:6,7-dimethyl-8-ribityllumazine synthase
MSVSAIRTSVTEITHQLAPPADDLGESGLVGSHDGRYLRIAVVCARFNDAVTVRLLKGALDTLDECGVSADNRLVVWVPGSFELPLAAQALAHSGRFDGVVCLGCVIRGETAHFDFVAGQCAAGLQRVQLDASLPVSLGVLTTENLTQALERSGGAVGNKGEEAVWTVIEMANVLKDVSVQVATTQSRQRTAQS